ncbi:MAG: hypothetical protein JWQ49_2511 [Edaphobacter sp.]|nr:hypothetical protein [Edaphobacter sp.]
MRNAGALVQFAVGNKLNPENNRIVIETHEGNITLIKLGSSSRFALIGKIYCLTMHAVSETEGEAQVLTEHIALRPNALLTIYLKMKPPEAYETRSYERVHPSLIHHLLRGRDIHFVIMGVVIMGEISRSGAPVKLSLVPDRVDGFFGYIFTLEFFQY